MKTISFCTMGHSSALLHARNSLLSWGYEVTSQPSDATTHLLLPVPSMDETGAIRGGPHFEDILPNLSPEITVLGGMLPELPCKCVDLLNDDFYIAENASITAHCAISFLTNRMAHTLKDTPALIIGWGRIGKCLAELLRSLSAKVTVAVRKESDCAILKALGYHSVIMGELDPKLYQLIINTAPAPVMRSTDASENALLIDLASKQGIEGQNVLWERGLPNRFAPESSGILIAKTALRYALRKE